MRLIYLRKSWLGIVAVVGYLLIVFPAYAHENHNAAPWAACEAQKRDSSCAFTDGHGDLYRGSCQVFSGSLMCVRNQPIVRNEGEAGAKFQAMQSHTSPAADASK